MKKWIYEPLNAPNVVELNMDMDKLREVRQYFDENIRPQLEIEINREELNRRAKWGERQRPLFQPYTIGESWSQDHWYVTGTGWTSDLRWVSVNNEKTHEKFSKLFYDFGVDKAFDGTGRFIGSSPHKPLDITKIDHKEQINIYSVFFVVRSESHGHNWHVDWMADLPIGESETEKYERSVRGPGGNVNAFSLMAPIQERQEDTIDLMYKDVDGKEQVYKYQMGRSVVFGEEFWHSTAKGKCSNYEAFLCFAFGSDKEEYQEINLQTIGGQAAHLMHPQMGWSKARLGANSSY